jgi:hypothetical protein
MTQTTIQVKNPSEPASEKQIHFLFEVLLVERDCPSVAEKARFAKGMGLTKGVASKLIGEALKAPKTGAKANTPVKQDDGSVTMFAETPKPVSLTDLPAFGYYLITDAVTGKPTVYYWDVTGKDGYPVLRKLTKVTQYDGKVKGKWNKINAWGSSAVQVTGTYTPYAGKGYNKTPLTKTILVHTILAKAVLAGATPMSMEQAAQQGHMLGFCIRCGATLTDPKSVTDGIGPVCKTYWF